MEDSVQSFWQMYGEAVKTSLGFFWKAGWAFILGYGISAMIQAFIPKGKLTPYMGKANFKSVSISTIFGSASSSCSFAALAAARALFMKGAHFVSTVAFMFASTNLVIELGILILIFLGWQFLAAEIIGGLLLIIISSLLIKLTYPKKWIEAAKEKVKAQNVAGEDNFDWKKRIRSKSGWYLVGNKFVSDWKMVWEEILIGFTIAGFIAVFVPASVWGIIFLQGMENELPTWLITVENALVAPFVAAATFIGSMGNIPLATVLNSNGILFVGIMGFIYSDLMVPPLVMINAKYYGKRVALYIAFIMYISIVTTALILHYLFALLSLTPQSSKRIDDISQFAFDYTFYLNVIFVAVTVVFIWLSKKHKETMDTSKPMKMEGSSVYKRIVALSFTAILIVGIFIYLLK
ncbi:MAG: permease [bacterium]|nr:permease [bacterium]